MLGLSDAPPRAATGTNAFQDTADIASKIRQNTRLNVEVHELNYEDKRILAFKIPSRPAGTAYEYKGAYYMRSGESLLPMTEDRGQIASNFQ